jgi:hypothetical protein
MRKSSDLEFRLAEWAKEYRGGKYDHIGWPSKSTLHAAMVFQGPPPRIAITRGVPITTAGDEVQDAVKALELQPVGERPAAVLRCEYFDPGAAIEHRLQKMRRIGMGCSRADYYQSLRVAKVHVAAWLRIRFCAEDEAA